MIDLVFFPNICYAIAGRTTVVHGGTTVVQQTPVVVSGGAVPMQPMQPMQPGYPQPMYGYQPMAVPPPYSARKLQSSKIKLDSTEVK